MSDIILRQNIVNDEYTDYVYKAYDIQDRDETVTTIANNLKLDFDFNVGVIFGPSGSGKSSIVRTLGEISKPEFDNSKAIVSNFPNLSPDEVTFLFSSVGLGSVPTWLRSHNNLSNGEQYRSTVAKILSEEKDLYLIDEYTSVVDRNVARSMSNALQKYVRRTGKKVILATPHEDVLEWLQPDFVYSTTTCQLERAGDFPLYRKPTLELEIFRCKYEAWNLFKQHHYLTDKLHESVACFMITWEGQIVGFSSTLDFPGLKSQGIKIKAKRFTRSVVLPDFQGLGIGTSVINYLSGLYKTAGYTCYTRTVNPARGEALLKNPNWQVKKENKIRDRSKNDLYTGEKKYLKKYLINRPSYSCKYIGEGIDGDLNIVLKKNKEL